MFKQGTDEVYSRDVTWHENNEGDTVFFVSKSTSGSKLTISKCLCDIVLHFKYIGGVQLGGIHELTLLGAACQLTEEGHQIEEAGGTPAHRRGECEKQNFKKETGSLHDLQNNKTS